MELSSPLEARGAVSGSYYRPGFCSTPGGPPLRSPLNVTRSSRGHGVAGAQLEAAAL